MNAKAKQVAGSPEGPAEPSTSAVRTLLRALVPPPVRRALRRRFLSIRWEGDYNSWPEAAARATGYHAPAILEKVQQALREVREGRALFERDGVAMREPAPPWPALPGITQAALSAGSRLRVLDFGGSLGSLYFQHKAAWDTFREVSWRVVEQPAFVAVGQRDLADSRLAFFATIESATAQGPTDVLLLSSVLQYLPEPHATLDLLLAKRFPLVVLDRVPLIDRGRDRLTIQHVPASINKASYPCWYFDRERLLAHFSAAYEIQAEFAGADGDRDGATYVGFVFKRLPQ